MDEAGLSAMIHVVMANMGEALNIITKDEYAAQLEEECNRPV